MSATRPATDERGNQIGGMWINPGSGPVLDSDEAAATETLTHFLTDLGLDHLRWLREPREDERGRYGFLLYQGTYEPVRRLTLLQMPGLPLDRVRYRKGLDALDFPRLYVDGSSWLWPFAVNCARAALTGENDE